MDFISKFQIGRNHIVNLKRAFMDCEMDDKAEMSLQEFVEKIKEME